MAQGSGAGAPAGKVEFFDGKAVGIELPAVNLVIGFQHESHRRLTDESRFDSPD